jgi:hypothetical protein
MARLMHDLHVAEVTGELPSLGALDLIRWATEEEEGVVEDTGECNHAEQPGHFRCHQRKVVSEGMATSCKR